MELNLHPWIDISLQYPLLNPRYEAPSNGKLNCQILKLMIQKYNRGRQLLSANTFRYIYLIPCGYNFRRYTMCGIVVDEENA